MQLSGALWLRASCTPHPTVRCQAGLSPGRHPVRKLIQSHKETGGQAELSPQRASIPLLCSSHQKRVTGPAHPRGEGDTSVTPRRRAPLEPPWECVKQMEGPSWYLGLKATPPSRAESRVRVASCGRAPSALWTETAPTRLPLGGGPSPGGGAPGRVTPEGGQLRAPVRFPAAAGRSRMSVCSREFVYGDTFAK